MYCGRYLKRHENNRTKLEEMWTQLASSVSVILWGALGMKGPVELPHFRDRGEPLPVFDCVLLKEEELSSRYLSVRLLGWIEDHSPEKLPMRRMLLAADLAAARVG